MIRQHSFTLAALARWRSEKAHDRVVLAVLCHRERPPVTECLRGIGCLAEVWLSLCDRYTGLSRLRRMPTRRIDWGWAGSPSPLLQPVCCRGRGQVDPPRSPDCFRPRRPESRWTDSSRALPSSPDCSKTHADPGDRWRKAREGRFPIRRCLYARSSSRIASITKRSGSREASS